MKNKRPPRKQVLVRLPLEIYDALKAQAQTENRSLGAQAATYLTQTLQPKPEPVTT